MKKIIPNIIMLILMSITLTLCVFEGDNPVVPEDKAVPYSPSPASGAIDQALALSLSWTAQGVSKWDVYLDKVSPPTIKYAADRTTSFITAAGLSPNTTYFWQVISKLSDGTTRTGPIWNFTTASGSSGIAGDILLHHKTYTELPSFVNVLFQVVDFDGRGIENLTTADFCLLEDGESVSPSESKLTVNKKTDVQYTMKTVLMLDNSTSIGSDITSVRSAANAFVTSFVTGPQTEVAIYVFSETPKMLQDFTSNLGVLQAVINGINVEFPTTDLFGAVIEGVKPWIDKYDIDEVIQGALVLFTDGTDTQGSHTLSDALAASSGKRVYTVGLGQEISPDTLDILGNAGFYSAADVSSLTQAFLDVESDLSRYTNSFYWLRYMSPKRGNFDHTLELSICNNQNTGAGSKIVDQFNSSTFFSTTLGLYINASAAHPYGIDTLQLGKYGSQIVTAASYLTPDPGNFTWSQADTNIAIVQAITGDNSRARITAKDSTAVTSTLIVDNQNVGLNKRLFIKVR